MVKWIIIAILACPVAEIAAFVLAASLIGLGQAFLLLLATTLIGILLLRQVGRGRITGFRVAVSDRNIAAVEAGSDGFLIILGAFLLALPGFITDVIGLLLLLGPVRRWCGRILRLVLHGHHRQANDVVDLDRDEWRQVPDRELENRCKPDRDD